MSAPFDESTLKGNEEELKRIKDAYFNLYEVYRARTAGGRGLGQTETAESKQLGIRLLQDEAKAERLTKKIEGMNDLMMDMASLPSPILHIAPGENEFQAMERFHKEWERVKKSIDDFEKTGVMHFDLGGL